MVPVGKIGRAHGVRGALRLYPYGESLAQQQAGDRLRVSDTARGGKEDTLTLTNLRPQGKFLIAQFSEITSLEEAERFIGHEVLLPMDRLAKTSEGEYYHCQLIGLEVRTIDGKVLGKIARIIETGSNDVYEVDHQGGEVLIPALEDVIVEVDLARGEMTVDPPEGLMNDL